MPLKARSVVCESPLERALGEPCLLALLNGLHPESKPTYRTNIRKWILWLWAKPEWAGKMPSELLDFQDQATGRQRLLLPRLMVQYVQERGGTYKSMLSCLSHLRSLFLHNDVEVPAVHWQPHPTAEPTKGQLTFDQVRNIILHADPRNTAIFLTMFQGLMDLERFRRFNLHYTMPLLTHLREKDPDEPFRIDFPGRKRSPRPFYTYIYRDAQQAWREYFAKERGWPERADEPLALTDKGGPPDKPAIRAAFRTIAERLHYRPETPKGKMSGVAPHEAFRDVVRSHLRLAKRDGFDLTCAEFWMGHSIDPYNYEKFTDLEPEYMLANAKIAARYLNIISGAAEHEEAPEQVQALREEVNNLKDAVQLLKDALHERVASKTMSQATIP